MAEAARCPLCHVSTSCQELSDFNVWPRVMECPRCGIYEVDERFLQDGGGYNTGPFPSLSGLARERHEQQQRLLITKENFRGLERQAPQTAMEKARKLLQAIARKSQPLGRVVELNPRVDFPLA